MPIVTLLRDRDVSAVLRTVFAVAVIGGLGSKSALAKPPLGRNWPAGRQVSMQQIDHAAFDALLYKYVDNDGYVDYGSWKDSSVDRRALQNYLVQLSRGSSRIRASREAQLAFWINAYNAVTLEGILQEFPTTSIRNHTSKLGYNIWKHLPLLVGGRSYSLETIENKILRPLGEPQIHFAIVCASVGCPRLRNEAYTTEKLHQQLADNTRDFFSQSQNMQVDAARKTIRFSSILKWYAGDFGRSQSARLAYLKPYLPASAQRLVTGGVTVRYLKYDWSLNDQSRKPRTASRR